MGTRFSRATEDADRHLAGFSKATEQDRYLIPPISTDGRTSNLLRLF